jgi:hypothetical protein
MTRAADLAKLIAGSSTLGGTGELVLKDVDTADGSSPKLTFQTGDTDIAADDVLGTIDFQAPDEGTGTDAILVSAGVEAKAEGDFSSSSNATSLTFKTGSSAAAAERMRIDSSGNVLVAKSSANATDVGIVANASGRLFATASGESSIFNRTSSDGDILDLRKDGTSEGAIAVASDELKIFATKSSTNCGFGFYSNNTIRPVGNDGAEADNEVSLGHSSNRFKDLYLSGGLYVGGTGSANYLDDYEEGTWTPTLIDGASSSRTISSAAGRYTKIGNVVHAEFTLLKNETGGSGGNLNVGGLPFTSTNTGTPAFYNGGMWADEGGPSTNQGDSVGGIYLPTNVAYVLGLKATNNAQQADYRYFRYEQITNSRGLTGAFTYKTDS